MKTCQLQPEFWSGQREKDLPGSEKQRVKRNIYYFLCRQGVRQRPVEHLIFNLQNPSPVAAVQWWHKANKQSWCVCVIITLHLPVMSSGIFPSAQQVTAAWLHCGLSNLLSKLPLDAMQQKIWQLRSSLMLWNRHLTGDSLFSSSFTTMVCLLSC